MESFDTFVNMTTSTPVPLSVTSIGWIVILMSTGVESAVTISNGVLYEIVMQKYIEQKSYLRPHNKLQTLLLNSLGKVHTIRRMIKNSFNLSLLFSQITKMRLGTILFF